jgi:glycosyltransferase involved in cell wall biosynthesis
MVEEMPPERVPSLVFAGRIGWMVQDLMQQIENSGHLGGKLVVVPDPTDSELAALYRGCRFTLFPSLYEGWGLPVTESLSFGKLCIASDRTSLPEAGGPFCLYIDPENITAATEIIRQACTDDALVAERETAIRDGFRPMPWRRSAEVLAGHLGVGANPGEG